MERRRFGSPLGSLRTAEGGKSGIDEVAFATVDTGQYYRVRHIIPRPHGHNMGRPWFTMLWKSLSLPRAESTSNFKVAHYRKSLISRRKEGSVQAVVFGEKWSIFDSVAQSMLERCPELSKDRDLCNYNPGISVVLL